MTAISKTTSPVPTRNSGEFSLFFGKKINRIMKYIIFNAANMGEETAIIFPDFIMDSVISDSLNRLVTFSLFQELNSNIMPMTRIISAGMVKMNRDGRLECFGGSEYLRITSRPGIDESIIEANLSGYRQ